MVFILTVLVVVVKATKVAINLTYNDTDKTEEFMKIGQMEIGKWLTA